ncbi:MAG TPA: hypothetical protein VFK43_23195, partial [Acidimicrobiales bacterium]|nr:hypothetical protein [Acidimicrobiales bacterium]
ALETATAAAAAAREAAEAAAAGEAAASEAATAARERFAACDLLQREHEAVVAEGKAVRAEHDAAADQVATLTAELAALEGVDAELAALRPEADGLAGAEARLGLLERLREAEARLDASGPAAPEPPEPDPAPAAALADAAREAAERVADLRGQRTAAATDLARARDALGRTADLSGEADCPLCGQALGDAFEQVRRHRAEEAEAAAARVAALDAEAAEAAESARVATAAATEAAQALDAARAARVAWERSSASRLAAEADVARCRAAVDPPPSGPGEAAELAAEVARRREAAARCHTLTGRLERRPVAARALEQATATVAETAGRLEALREKVRALGFDREALDAARAARDAADAALEQARATARRLDGEAAGAAAMAAGATAALADAEAQHARLADLAEEARHVGRVSDLLQSFRNELVAEVGPRLSMQAAGLFAELTDGEYDELRVDPDTYEVRILDQGVEYGMDRFSGSETDLANLALRVAISEQVRFQSGGQVGLLVLDEVFGPLDDDRKERMLLALERLRARFRQVLVVTHDREIKEQLPTAVEVVKLPGRRATARLLGT